MLMMIRRKTKKRKTRRRKIRKNQKIIKPQLQPKPRQQPSIQENITHSLVLPVPGYLGIRKKKKIT